MAPNRRHDPVHQEGLGDGYGDSLRRTWWASEVPPHEPASDFSAATCLEAGGTDLTATDSAVPASIYYYLVAIDSGCGLEAGAASDDVPHSVPDCTP